MNISIAPMTFEHLDEVLHIINEHKQSDSKEARKYFSEYLNSPERLASEREQNFVSILPDTKTVEGVCGFMPDEHNTPHLLWLSWFYVRKDLCGQGIGRKLLTHTMDIIQTLPGIKKVYLDTASSNTYKTAIRTYRKVGFQLESYLLNYYDHNTSYIVMAKNLSND